MEDDPTLKKASSRVVGVWPPKTAEAPKKDTPVNVLKNIPEPVVVTSPPKDDDNRIVGGLNQVIAAKQEQRYDKALEKELREWLAEKLPNCKDTLLNNDKSFHQILKSGVILCNLLNEIRPNIIKNISNLKVPFKQMENIASYMKGCSLLGVPQTALFATVDLYEGKDMPNVLIHLQYIRQHLKTSDTENVAVLAKRERISQLIKNKETSPSDASWRKDNPSEVVTKAAPVSQKPREQASPSAPAPDWKKNLMEREQKGLEERKKEEDLRRQKFQQQNNVQQQQKQQQNYVQQQQQQQQQQNETTSNMSNREILQAQARQGAVERISEKRGVEAPQSPNTPLLYVRPVVSRGTPVDDSHRSTTTNVTKDDSNVALRPKDSPWKVQLRKSPTAQPQRTPLSNVSPPNPDIPKSTITRDAHPKVEQDRPESRKTLQEIITERKQQRIIEDAEKSKQKEEIDKKFEIEKEKQILSGHPFFGAGKTRGLEVWRIENFQAVPWPKNKYGVFCTGDSYIVLYSQREGGPWDIFFWLGDESSQDEKGAAALKTVELDDRLGGSATHHREIQYHESEQFLSLFKGIEYTSEGAVDSAFTKVDRDAFTTRLLHLKGTRNVRIRPTTVSYQSLNSGDVFILETATTIWQWNGSESSRREKLTGLQSTTRMRDARGAKPKIEVLEEGNEPKEFWDALGGKGPIKTADEGGSDEQYEKVTNSAIKLYHVSDASGKIEVTFISSAPLKQEMLNSDDCHILDIGTELFVWVGRGCTEQEKIQSMAHAEAFLKNDPDRPDWVPITRVIDGGETMVFKAQFSSWRDTNSSTNQNENMWGGTMAKFDAYQERQRKLREENANRKIDMASLISTRNIKKEDFTTREGKILIWRIENFKAVPLKTSDYGIFFGGDSYLVHFTPESRKEPPLLYYWLGRRSTKDEQGAAVLLAKDIAEKFQGDRMLATHVRVTQGKEPGHFLNLFKGKFIIRFGGVASGFKNVDENDEIDDESNQLFHVHGNSAIDTKAVQVSLMASSLNSADTFVLNTEKIQYIWYGKGCEEIEREYANKAADFLNKDRTVIIVEEENEPDEFWHALGGKGEYQNSPELQAEVREGRLFHCSNASGKFEIEEIYNYGQDDLLLDDVYLLDVYSCVMVWVGPESNEEEKLKSFEMALEYVRQASQIDGRDPDCSVVRVLAGAEPPMFTRWFHGWDDTRGENDAYRLALESLKNEGPAVMDVKAALDEYKRVETMKFSYNELRRTANNPLPNGGKGIDRANLEKYLTDEEFERIFKMKREAWEKVPKWKKDTLKQRARLF